ncbi:MAG: hypothetical protein ACK4UN_06335 [Limisphaerales bacterium]
MTKAQTKEHHRIEIKLREISQLFNSMDPSPFHEKDLDSDAEEFIESWVSEYPRHDPVTLVIHLQQLPPEGDSAGLVETAIHNFFAYKAKLNEREFKRLLKQGRMSLFIGLLFLSTCLFLSKLITQYGTGTFYEILSEGFIIAGWVAMWKPMEIYLYDWWPLRRRGQILKKMSRMQVIVKNRAT